MIIQPRTLICLIALMTINAIAFAKGDTSMISSKVLSIDNEPINYATVFVKGTSFFCSTDEKGLYHLRVPEGDYTMFFSSVGFEKKEVKISVVEKERKQLTVKLNPTTELSEVIVVSNPLSKVKNSAFNATAINTHELINTTKTLSEALSKAPGMKIRESGGVGSDMAVTMDGFSGKHVKVFIDGVPQEGVGNSFSLNNIPVSFAERIEVYRGVVPVGFGAPWRRRKDNVLTVTYDNQYTHRFCYYTANIGYNNSDYMVPDQFAHNLTFTYALRNGRYNLSFECRNFTNANLYDNFSLQKAGRAFYGKVRIYFGN